jgi:uncharacterized membrane protein
MKKYFVTGLVILLPLALTLAIVIFLFNLLTQPFAGIVQSIFTHYNIFQNGFLFLSADQVQRYIGQLVILLFLFFFTVSLGILARWFFIHYIIRFSEKVFLRIPFINSIYNACKDVIKTIFASQNNSFKQVVMVRFPNVDTYSIGLVTRENLPNIHGGEEKLTAVFVPTTPNPTSGFLMMFKESELTYLNMKVEDAFKYIISCGVIAPSFQVLEKQDDDFTISEDKV